MARTTAGRIGATTYVVPVLAVLMSWLVLGEVPGLLTLLGGVLCLAGVAVSRFRSGEPAVMPPVPAEADVRVTSALPR